MQQINVSDSNALYLNLENANFLWNNEYFNNVVKGYTLIGYNLIPQLQYHFSPNIYIDAGIYMQKYSGIDDYSYLTPTYRVTYRKNDFELIFGTLKGTIQHKLPDQILFSELYFTRNNENGIQYKLTKERFLFDTWIDWQNFIFPLDDEQEVIKAGISAHPYLLKNSNWNISIPTGLLVGHRGGQIDTVDLNMQTALNYNLGIKTTKHVKLSFLNHITSEVSYLGFIDNSPVVEIIYSNGYGFLGKLSLHNNYGFIDFGYWHSQGFLSLMGNPMYQSFSENGPDQHQKTRNLITTQFFYTKDIYKGIYLGIMADTYYDLKSNDLDYSMGITLIIKQNFFLKRFN